ncbi:hypothetical protein NKH47_08170 [Mesorhizobium sp. M1060]|uniref:beta-ketoacyl synthase N-terminal-like domain-containing protein n=1 Tax=Mesorhizobium sp. M1060 TaxID=2957052 RepID=UPI00333672D4
MDAITALGSDWRSTWAGLLAGRDGTSSWSASSSSFAAAAAVAAVEGFDRHVDLLGRGPATRMLLEMYRRLQASSPTRVPVHGASNHGETDTLIGLAERLHGYDKSVAPPSQWWALLVDPLPASLLGNDKGSWLSSACSSGMHALVAAYAGVLQGGMSNAAVAADALSAIGVVGFARVGAATQEAARPFLTDRCGLVIGEGAAALRLDTYGDGPAILGVGLSCDASHPTDPNPDGTYLASAIRDAIGAAGLPLSDISGIVAHGTATRKNDEAEAAAFRSIWADNIPPVTSIKRGVGHTMGVAGLLNVMAAAEALKEGVLPPAVATGQVMASIDLVRGNPRPISRNGALIALASGFGGNNAAVLISNKLG